MDPLLPSLLAKTQFSVCSPEGIRPSIISPRKTPPRGLCLGSQSCSSLPVSEYTFELQDVRKTCYFKVVSKNTAIESKKKKKSVKICSMPSYRLCGKGGGREEKKMNSDYIICQMSL